MGTYGGWPSEAEVGATQPFAYKTDGCLPWRDVVVWSPYRLAVLSQAITWPTRCATLMLQRPFWSRGAESPALLAWPTDSRRDYQWKRRCNAAACFQPRLLYVRYPGSMEHSQSPRESSGKLGPGESTERVTIKAKILGECCPRSERRLA